VYCSDYITGLCIASYGLLFLPIPVATRSKAWVGGSSFAGISGSNPVGSMSFVSYQVEISASGLSLVQRSTTECGVPECNREASTLNLSLSN
jgi:hypothetical protein